MNSTTGKISPTTLVSSLQTLTGLSVDNLNQGDSAHGSIISGGAMTTITAKSVNKILTGSAADGYTYDFNSTDTGNGNGQGNNMGGATLAAFAKPIKTAAPGITSVSVGQVDDNSFTAKPAVSRPQDALWQPLVQRDNRTKDLLFGTPYRKEVKEAFPVSKVSSPSVSLDYETDLSVFEEALQDVPATMVPSASLGDETLHDTVGSQERILDRIFSNEVRDNGIQASAVVLGFGLGLLHEHAHARRSRPTSTGKRLA